MAVLAWLAEPVLIIRHVVNGTPHGTVRHCRRTIGIVLDMRPLDVLVKTVRNEWLSAPSRKRADMPMQGRLDQLGAGSICLRCTVRSSCNALQARQPSYEIPW